MRNWVVMMKKADFNRTAKKFGVSPIIARLLRNRDLTDDDAIEEYLRGDETFTKDPFRMKDMDKAVRILRRKIGEGKKIRVIGDYDIDGVNAAFILLSGLKRCGADVDTDIPDRVKDGYGLSDDLITKARDEGVDTIVTCDNGIAAAAAVAYARCLDMTVIVTDHHQVPFEETEEGRVTYPPEADAVIDPHQDGCDYPYKELCGAAVAFKMVQALYQTFAIDRQEADSFLENVAIATVGDVVDLTGENRIFVKIGLKKAERTENYGLRALIDLCGLSDKPLNTYDIGFVLGPCINAGGRLDTAKRALALFEADDRKEADILAGDLKALNESRKTMTLKGVEEAIRLIETSNLKNDKVLVVYLPDCHESLAGIIAGRIREKYNRPTFTLTKSQNVIKGSGRSIEAYSMYEELTKSESLLLKFGGHPMAAGLSMNPENLDEFRKQINANCTLTDEDLIPKITIDMPLPFEYATEELVKELKILEPFGKGNKTPLFAERKAEITRLAIRGKDRNVCSLSLRNERGAHMEGVYFGETEEFLQYLSAKYGENAVQNLERGKTSGVTIDITYYPTINEYRMNRTVQAVIKNYR